MTEKTEAKIEEKEKKVEEKTKEIKIEEKKETKAEEKVNAEEKAAAETKKEIKKKEAPKIQRVKKEEAIARGVSVTASKKHCMYICNFIKNKPIDKAIYQLEEVIKFKRAIPFKGEIPHRKGMMSGRYPVKTAAIFIKILKGLKGNVLVNNMDLDKTRIANASANWASRPMRKEGRKAKRSHIVLTAREVGENK